MKAIILAAGIGKRIGKYGNKPKCLIEIEGKTLLERYLVSLRKCGIEEIVIVTGYKRELIRQKIDSFSFNMDIKLITNPEYEKGSILSLWAAKSELKGDIVLMDGDVFFEQEVLDRLIKSEHSNAVLIDGKYTNTGEECIIGTKDNKVSTMARGLSGNYDILGEWVGFIKMDQAATSMLYEITDANVKKDNVNMGYEDTFSVFFKKIKFGFEIIDGLKWVEIDFPTDIEKARCLNIKEKAL